MSRLLSLSFHWGIYRGLYKFMYVREDAARNYVHEYVHVRPPGSITSINRCQPCTKGILYYSIGHLCFGASADHQSLSDSFTKIRSESETDHLNKKYLHLHEMIDSFLVEPYSSALHFFALKFWALALKIW